jgi:catechol 2,3-dioxygenase-like lactoylglutathione lyase family enzyme
VLHHLDLNVSDLAASAAFYGPLLSRWGYARAENGRGWEVWRGAGAYLTLVQAPQPHVASGYHRRRVGLNHLAFAAPSREAVNELLAWLSARGASILYGGPMEMGTAEAPNYALFFEDPDRVKLEFVYRPAD